MLRNEGGALDAGDGQNPCHPRLHQSLRQLLSLRASALDDLGLSFAFGQGRTNAGPNEIVAILAAAISRSIPKSHRYPNPETAATRKAARAAAIPIFSIFWALGASPLRMLASATRNRRSATVTVTM